MSTDRSGFTSTRPGLPRGSDRPGRCIPDRFQMFCSVNVQPTGYSTYPVGFCYAYTVFVNFTTDRVAVWTDRSSFIARPIVLPSKNPAEYICIAGFTCSLHDLVTLCYWWNIRNWLFFVSFHAYAFDPVGCCKVHFSSPDRFFFQTDRVHKPKKL